MSGVRRFALLAALLLVPAGVVAQPIAFLEVRGADGGAPVVLAVAQVVRLGRLESETVIDTAAYVQLRSAEPLEALARRLGAAGLALVALTDLSGARTFVAADRIVSVRPANVRHAPGARASLIITGLRFTTDVAVRESTAEVMAAIERAVAVPR